MARRRNAKPMSVIESVKDFVASYPPLSNGHIVINDDVLINYEIDEIETEPVYRQYVGGDSLIQTTLSFVTAEGTLAENVKLLASSGFCEGLSGWLEDQSDNGSLPQLESGKSQAIVILTNGYKVTSGDDPNIPRYEMRFKLIYTK